MAEAVIKLFSRFSGLGKITGPIFDKELRVSSRRRRNYVLRFIYLLALTIFVALVWMNTVRFHAGSSAVHNISRMAEAGKVIIATVAWFQFCALQLIGVILLSNSISDEINHKTLGTLMTTPISSFQIVMGKLFSKLWQLMILMAISIPILAIVRVFGGVPWNYIISSVCITFSATVFAGSVSMFYSIRTKRAYAVILKTLFTGGVLFAFVPFMLGWLFFSHGPGQSFLLIAYANPFIAMGYETAMMTTPMARMGAPEIYWQAHCLVMLGLSAVVLLRTTVAVRKIALRQATGDVNPFNRKRKTAGKPAPVAAKSQAGPPPLPGQQAAAGYAVVDENPTGRIRRVKGSPILWKELRTPLIAGNKSRSIIGLVLALIALLITYIVCINTDCLDENETHTVYGIIFVLMGTICTSVFAATPITAEKEARTWPILLCTAQTDWAILWGKAGGVFRRCLPIWLLLTIHTIIFIVVGYIHPIALPLLLISIAGIVAFLTGTGLYFSSCFKKTTSAVVMNFALGIFLWALLPMLMGMFHGIVGGSDDLLEAYMCANPVVQTGIIMNETSGHRATLALNELNFDWPGFRSWSETATATIRIVITIALLYAAIGLLFAHQAKNRLRKNIW